MSINRNDYNTLDDYIIARELEWEKVQAHMEKIRRYDAEIESRRAKLKSQKKDVCIVVTLGPSSIEDIENEITKRGFINGFKI